MQPHLVEKRDFVQGRKLKVLCVNGDEHEYPTAEVYLYIRGQTYQMMVGVVERLSNPVVIGQDITVLPELVQSSRPVNMVITRSQSQAQDPEKEETDESTEPNSLSELPFSEEENTPPAKTKCRKSRRQRRQARLVGAMERSEELQLTQPVDDWDEVPDNFEQLQREDPTLQKAYDRVTQVDGMSTEMPTSLSGEGYVVKEGLLYHEPGDGRATGGS